MMDVYIPPFVGVQGVAGVKRSQFAGQSINELVKDLDMEGPIFARIDFRGVTLTADQ